MPELPEVEQVRKTLRKHIVDRTITQVVVGLERLIKIPTAAEFVQQVEGRTIVDIARKGKYLSLVLDNGSKILLHLRMTGALIAAPRGQEPPYAKIQFVLNGEEDLWFTDIRTFGTLYLVQDECEVSGYATLGLEPNDPELTVDYLQAQAGRKKVPVKNFILDQTVIAGLGNIYADEALFVAGIVPTRGIDTLTAGEYRALLEAVNQVITQGIANKGTTFRDYKDGEGNKGTNQNYLWAYGRKGQKCKKCGELLLGTKVGGRGTCYCPQCQK